MTRTPSSELLDQHLARRWLGLALAVLVIAGVFALLLVLGRMPPFDRLVTATRERGFRPPQLQELAAESGLSPKQVDGLLARAIDEGHIEQVGDSIEHFSDLIVSRISRLNIHCLLSEMKRLPNDAHRDHPSCTFPSDLSAN